MSCRRRAKHPRATACRSSTTRDRLWTMPRSSSPCCRAASTCCRCGTTSCRARGRARCSSIARPSTLTSARKAHALAAARGIATLDAPVSGGVGGAKAATLTFMVGGSEHAFARGKPVLERMGKRIVHCGEAGNGQVAKICNNLILGASMIAVSEGFVLGEKLGLSHQALFDVVSGSSGQCWSLTSYCPVPGPVPASPANNGYKPGFTAALMLKDLNLARAGGAIGGRRRCARCACWRDLRAVRRAGPQRAGLFRDRQPRARAFEEALKRIRFY